MTSALNRIAFDASVEATAVAQHDEVAGTVKAGFAPLTSSGAPIDVISVIARWE
jgi:hypothetical protein